MTGQVVVVGVGIAPNDLLAGESGLAVGNGVDVDVLADPGVPPWACDAGRTDPQASSFPRLAGTVTMGQAPAARGGHGKRHREHVAQAGTSVDHLSGRVRGVRAGGRRAAPGRCSGRSADARRDGPARGAVLGAAAGPPQLPRDLPGGGTNGPTRRAPGRRRGSRPGCRRPRSPADRWPRAAPAPTPLRCGAGRGNGPDTTRTFVSGSNDIEVRWGSCPR